MKRLRERADAPAQDLRSPLAPTQLLRVLAVESRPVVLAPGLLDDGAWQPRFSSDS